MKRIQVLISMVIVMAATTALVAGEAAAPAAPPAPVATPSAAPAGGAKAPAAPTSSIPTGCKLVVIEHDSVRLKGEQITYVGDIVADTDTELTILTLQHIKAVFPKDKIEEIKRKTTLSGAYEAARKAAGVNPKEHAALGAMCLQCGLEVEAMAEFHESIRLSPKSPDAYRAMQDYYHHKGNADAELEAGLEAAKVVADPAPFLIANGAVYEAAGLPSKAVGQYQAAIKKDATAVEPYLALAEFYVRHGDADKAAQMYGEVIGLRDSNTQALDGMGRVELMRGNLDAARKYFLKATADAKFADPHNGLGAVEMAKGDLKRAQEEFERALALDAKNAYANLNLGLLLLAKGEKAKGQAHLIEATNGLPADYTPLLLANGYLYEQLEDYGKAAEQYSACLEQDSSNVQALCGLGRALAAQGKLDKAGEMFRNALLFDPANRAALEGQAYVAYRLKKYGDAAKVVERLAQANPDDQTLVAYSGLIQASDSYQLPQAAATLKDVLKKDPDDAAAQVGMGYVSLLMGDNEQATRYLDQAARSGYASAYARKLLDILQASRTEVTDADDFSRPGGNSPDVRKNWTENEGNGISIAIKENRLCFEGTRQGEEGRTWLTRTTGGANFLRVEATLDVPEESRATAGLRVALQRKELILAIRPNRKLVYATTSAGGGVPQWTPINVPALQPKDKVVLRIVLLDAKKGTFQFYSNSGEALLTTPIDVPGLPGNQEFEVGIVAVTAANEQCRFFGESFKTVHRKVE